MKTMKRSSVALLAMAVASVATGALVPAQAQETVVKNGEKIAFLGDSITQQGADRPSGYARLVMSGLAANNIQAEPVFAGISGHKSNDMLGRLDNDVISKKPNWMTLSCGVNDVWHQERNRGILIDEYKKNITQIVDKAQAAGIKVVILTSTMIGEDQSAPNNQKLIPYNDFLRALAAERKLPLADLNADMQAAIKALPANKGNWLTTDGVHMGARGNQMMAAGVLKAFGLNEAQLQKARDSWGNIQQGTNVNLTLKQLNILTELAARQNKSLSDLVAEFLNRGIETQVQK